MSGKKVTIFLSCLALIGTLQAANLVVNGDFEQLPGGTAWSAWWGGNSNRYVDDPYNADPLDHCAGVWWDDDGIFQTVPIGPGIYEFGGKISSPGLTGRRCVIRAEVKDMYGATLWSQDLDIVPGDPANVWLVAPPQEGFPNSATIDNTTAGATQVTLNMFMLDTVIHTGGGIVRYDEIYLGPRGVAKQAKFPHPINNEIGVQAVNTVIRWINAEPNEPTDIMTSDVFLGTSPASLSQIADDTTAESLTLSALVPPMTLLPNTQYYWRVDCTDPHGDPNFETPVTTTGDVWTFTTTNDNPPTVNAGADKYLWLDMADGDGDPAKVTFTLNGAIGDDAKSPLTSLWALTYSEQDPATVINIVSPNTAATSVNINGTGLYTFTLNADDAFSHAEDAVTVIVYGNACEAAQGDPADMPTRYPNGHGDINGDCLTNLTDLAIMAASWIDCMSAKLGCTP